VTDSLSPSERKNPALPVSAPVLPPSARSRVALGLTAAACLGRFELQVCRDCATVQYPPREACHCCLSLRLDWTLQSGEGELISQTTLTHSHNEYFRERLPWRLGMVRLDCGPTVVTHLHGDVGLAPARVRVRARLDRSGQAALVAMPAQELSTMTDDKQLREMTCNPQGRKVLVSDITTPTGQALVRALVNAGADTVWAGHPGSSKTLPGIAELQRLAHVTLIALDVTRSDSVRQAAAQIGANLDILINNAELHRAHGISGQSGVETARAEMDVNYFGLLRLAQEFSPALRARGAVGQSSTPAWVNVLSVFALANFPAHGTFSASKAATHSLSQCLRAEMQPWGVRVINIFPGPIDDAWSQTLPLPKLSPDALARAIVNALREGIEDVYPGDVAQEWLARWRENPKVLERELAAASEANK
jgi:NAD(P)-dependent dehydrogenase (short-subunit alcohol dehydrogenase family)/uncharacterized OB-fold protein